MHRYSWAAITALVLIASACSSDGDADGEQTGGAAGMSGDGGSSGTAGGSGGSSAGTGGSGTGGAGGSAAAGAAGAATGGTGGAAATGGNGGGGGTGGSGGGGSGGVPGATVVCGANTCTLSNEMCCDYHNTDPVCFEKGTYCFPGVDVTCDGPEDCGDGDICCAKVLIHAQTRQYLSMMCQATCVASDERVVCGAAGTCPSGETCAESDMAPPYRDCT